MVIKNITGVGKRSNGIVYNPDNKLMYVTNFDEDSLSVINSSSNEVIKNITGVGRNPSPITYNPKDRTIYVAAQNLFSVINSSNTISKRIEYGDDRHVIIPSHILYNPSNNNIYITDISNELVLIFNFINNTNYIPMRSNNGPIEYNPDNNQIYIEYDLGITIFNSTIKSTIHEIKLSESYWDLTYNPEGDLIYATALEQGFISVINSSNKVSSQNEISDDGDYPKIAIRDREANLRGVIYKPESNLTGVTYFPDNHSLYVISPNKLNNQVPKYSIFVINSDGELVKQIPISIDNPVNDIKYNSDNKYLVSISR